MRARARRFIAAAIIMLAGDYDFEFRRASPCAAYYLPARDSSFTPPWAHLLSAGTLQLERRSHNSNPLRHTNLGANERRGQRARTSAGRRFGTKRPTADRRDRSSLLERASANLINCRGRATPPSSLPAVHLHVRATGRKLGAFQGLLLCRWRGAEMAAETKPAPASTQRGGLK